MLESDNSLADAVEAHRQREAAAAHEHATQLAKLRAERDDLAVNLARDVRVRVTDPDPNPNPSPNPNPNPNPNPSPNPNPNPNPSH